MGVVLGNHSQFDGAVQGRFWIFPRCLQLLPHRPPHRWTTSVSSATPSWLWARSSLRTKTTPRLLRTYPPVSRSTRRSCGAVHVSKKGLPALKIRCEELLLQPRGTKGESGGQNSITSDISNKLKLGLTSLLWFTDAYASVKPLINATKYLKINETSMNDFLPTKSYLFFKSS